MELFQVLLVFGGSTTNVMDGSRHGFLRAAVRIWLISAVPTARRQGPLLDRNPDIPTRSRLTDRL